MCEPLDIDSTAGAERLTELVTTRILQNIGGEKMGDVLVDAYRARFVKGYLSSSAAAAAQSKPLRSDVTSEPLIHF